MSKLGDLDDGLNKNERIHILCTKAMKTSLAGIARDYHVTVSDIIRDAVFHYTETRYPEFSDVYETNASLLRESK